MEWRIPGSNRPRSENPHGDRVSPRGADAETHIGTHSGSALGASSVPGFLVDDPIDYEAGMAALRRMPVVPCDDEPVIAPPCPVGRVDHKIGHGLRDRRAAESHRIAHLFRAGWL